METACSIVSVGKRRDGGTRYWCVAHKADATAKYGRRARRCRYAHILPVTEKETLTADVADYRGGVGLWGAVPPIYDTTELPLDRGVHVHARRRRGGRKDIDETFRAVRLLDAAAGLPPQGVVITELDAIYFMVSSVFGFPTRYVECLHCGWPHLDKDWFAVHPHRGHLCSGCGKHFRDVVVAVGNPVAALRERYPARPVRRTRTRLRLKQADYPGGVRVWGSNAAIVWTAPQSEEEGIHVHAHKAGQDEPTIDGTFGSVEIDGIRLDARAVRLLMAQSALPHVAGRVVRLGCPNCDRDHTDEGSDAFTPKPTRRCAGCGSEVRSTGRYRNVISNGSVGTVAALAIKAVRPPQKHELRLIPETL
jgi:hypothetical protein